MPRLPLALAVGGVLAASPRYRLAVTVSLSTLTLPVMAGCSSTTSTAGPATASPSSPAGQTYASKAFVVPLTVTVGTSLKKPPIPFRSMHYARRLPVLTFHVTWKEVSGKAGYQTELGYVLSTISSLGVHRT